MLALSIVLHFVTAHAVVVAVCHCIAGEVTAAQALLTACEECSKVCKHIGEVFDAAVQQHKEQHPQTQDVDMAG